MNSNYQQQRERRQANVLQYLTDCLHNRHHEISRLKAEITNTRQQLCKARRELYELRERIECDCKCSSQ